MLNPTSLREQVYDYLRGQMQQGAILPGAMVDMNALSHDLGVSKTPLRDALIMLERDGFVDILPRRGFRVRAITLDDVRNLYEILGTLEGMAIERYFHRLGPTQLAHFEDLNRGMREAVHRGDFNVYYRLNLEFHNVYLGFSKNREMLNYISILKQRLYDFPRRGYIPDWELRNCDEHEQFIAYIRAGVQSGAVSLMRDLHWSYAMQEDYILPFYKKLQDHLDSQMAAGA